MLRFTLVLVFLAAVLSPTLSAQKVKKLKAHEVELDQLPLDPLGGYFRTYSLRFDNFKALRDITGKAEKKMNKDYFSLNRYVFADGQGDFNAYLSLGNNFEPTRTTARKAVQAGTRDAPVQDTQAYYNVTLQLPLALRILDGERKLIREVDLSGFKSQMAFEFGPFGTDAELAAKWQSEGLTKLRANRITYLDQAFNYAAARLRSEIDSSVVTRRVNFVTIKKAEKYGIADLETDADRATHALEAFAKNKDRAALIDALKPLVDKWRNAPDKYDPNNKKEDDIRYAFAHNLALAAYLTGNLEAADAGLTAGFDWGKNSSWYRELRQSVNVDNARKRRDNKEWKPTKFTDVFQLKKPEIRRLKVISNAMSGKPDSYLVSKDTVYTSFAFFQKNKGKKLPKLNISDDTHKVTYHPIQMRTIFDGKNFYETIEAPKIDNVARHWMLVKLVTNLSNGAVKLGLVERGKTKDGEDSTLPKEYIVYGAKIRRSVNLSGTDFATDFNAGVLEFFGPEYPDVADKARAKAYAAGMEGYKVLLEDLAK